MKTDLLLKNAATGLMLLAICGNAVAQQKETNHNDNAEQAVAKVQKITICHVNAGNTHTMQVPPSALAAHLAHGDYLGDCGNSTPPVDEDTLYFGIALRQAQTGNGDIEVLSAADAGHKIYPNPSNGNFSLEIAGEAGANIEVMDMMGRTIERRHVAAGEKRTDFQLNNVAEGIYHVRVHSGSTHWSSTINIQ